MGIDKVFDKLAAYLNFVIDFLMLRGLEPFVRLDSVSGDLISFALIGILFALIMQYATELPTLSSEDVDVSGAEATPGAARFLDKNQFALFVPLVVVGAILFHFTLLVCWMVGGLAIGSFKDTLNATLAGATVAYPTQALAARLSRFAKSIGPVARLTAIALHLVSAAVNFLMVYYYFHAAAVIHRLPPRQILWPLGIFAVLMVALILLLAYFVGLARRASAVASLRPHPG